MKGEQRERREQEEREKERKKERNRYKAARKSQKKMVPVIFDAHLCGSRRSECPAEGGSTVWDLKMEDCGRAVVAAAGKYEGKRSQENTFIPEPK